MISRQLLRVGSPLRRHVVTRAYQVNMTLQNAAQKSISKSTPIATSAASSGGSKLAIGAGDTTRMLQETLCIFGSSSKSNNA